MCPSWPHLCFLCSPFTLSWRNWASMASVLWTGHGNSTVIDTLFYLCLTQTVAAPLLLNEDLTCKWIQQGKEQSCLMYRRTSLYCHELRRIVHGLYTEWSHNWSSVCMSEWMNNSGSMEELWGMRTYVGNEDGRESKVLPLLMRRPDRRWKWVPARMNGE